MFKVDVYLRVRRAVMVEGKSIREVSREFGLHRDTVRKMLAYSVPPGYRRQSPPKRPKLEPYTGVIDWILEDDLRRPRKQRHTAKRIKLGLDRARGEGRRIGRPPALSPEQVEQCRRMADEGAGLRQIARVMQCSPATVKKTLVGCQPQSGAPQRQEPLVG